MSEPSGNAGKLPASEKTIVVGCPVSVGASLKLPDGMTIDETKLSPEPSTTAEENHRDKEFWESQKLTPESDEQLAQRYCLENSLPVGGPIGLGDYGDAFLAGYRARDAEVAELKALLHEEAKDYAETIMKLCEECGVESIQDIGPKLAELKAEHDRLQEDLCEKVVSEGGALEATLAALQKQNEGMRLALEKIADPRKRHVEPDAYTNLCCVMHIANEALAAADEKEKE